MAAPSTTANATPVFGRQLGPPPQYPEPPAVPTHPPPAQSLPPVIPQLIHGEVGTAQIQQGINPSLELPIALPNGARITRKTFLAAKSGDYVNLPEFAPNSEPSAVMESVIDELTGNLVFKSKSVKKAIDSFLSWSRAWAGYESLLISMNPVLYQSLSDYRLFIQSCDATYHWQAVTSYDMRHRHRISMSHSLDFTVCSTDIYVVTLNANTIRPSSKGCYSCGSLDHNMKDCPFQKNAARPQSQSARKNFPVSSNPTRSNVNNTFTPRSESQAYEREGQKPTICYNFNNGRCHSPACWRLHACSGCNGPEPRVTCSRCNAPKG
jgi:hypothetical protein